MHDEPTTPTAPSLLLTPSATRGSGAMATRLRTTGRPRPAADPALAGGLRAWLEDEAADIAVGLDRGDRTPVRVVDDRALVAGAAMTGAPPPLPARWSHGRLELQMVRAVFRQVVTAGAPGNPFDAALAALAVGAGGPDVARALGSMDRQRRDALRADVNRHGSHVAGDWQPIPGGWLPRTGERIVVPLAGGRVVLSATADLALGAPASDRASVCLLDIQTGAPTARHAALRGLLALAETVRSGTAPFRVATYYSGTRELIADDVDQALLTGALRAVARLLSPGAVATVPAAVPAPARCADGRPSLTDDEVQAA